ncbi:MULTISPECIES: hypothetical protein [unclassified Pseudomonas]|uniref:hypothetical protein n=1 Tax=unclassified Pseudomonas TaxID=196821 RepID=UPI0035C0576C
MIDLSDWSASWRLVVLLPPLVVALVGLGINAHIAGSRHFKVMCSALGRSRCLHEELRRGGAFTVKLRVLTVCAMTGVFLCPGLSIGRGNLDPEDYREFPDYLKRRMKVAIACMAIGMGWSAFMYFLVEFASA